MHVLTRASRSDTYGFQLVSPLSLLQRALAQPPVPDEPAEELPEVFGRARGRGRGWGHPASVTLRRRCRLWPRSLGSTLQSTRSYGQAGGSFGFTGWRTLGVPHFCLRPYVCMLMNMPRRGDVGRFFNLTYGDGTPILGQPSKSHVILSNELKSSTTTTVSGWRAFQSVPLRRRPPVSDTRRHKSATSSFATFSPKAWIFPATLRRGMSPRAARDAVRRNVTKKSPARLRREISFS